MKIKLIRSVIGKSPDVRKTVRALGLRKMGAEKTVDESQKAVMGMVARVRHMLKVEK